MRQLVWEIVKLLKYPGRYGILWPYLFTVYVQIKQITTWVLFWDHISINRRYSCYWRGGSVNSELILCTRECKSVLLYVWLCISVRSVSLPFTSDGSDSQFYFRFTRGGKTKTKAELKSIFVEVTSVWLSDPDRGWGFLKISASSSHSKTVARTAECSSQIIHLRNSWIGVTPD